jgi:L-lactate utilization protein LutC
MSDNNNQVNNTEAEEPKKKSLAEVAKEMLAQKKQAQVNAKNQPNHQKSMNQSMKSQQTKKISNTRRKMGV